MPAVSFRSLIGSGTPRNGPSGQLAARAAARGLLGADGHVGVQLGVEPLDPLQVGLDELDRRDLAAPDEIGLLGRGQEGEAVHSLRSSISTAITGPGRRVLAVLRVLRGEQLEAWGSSTIRARAAQPHPPEPRPVLVVVVDQHLDARIGLDVAQPLQAPGPLRLLVDRRVQRVALDHEADRDDVRPPGRRRRSRGARPARPQATARPGRTSSAGRRRRARVDRRVERLGERRRRRTTRRRARGRACRTASSAGAARGRRRGSPPPSARAAAPGRGSRRPRARSTRSSACRRGRSRPPASAACAPSSPSFTQDAWMFVIHGMQREPPDRVHEQRLAEGRAAARLARRGRSAPPCARTAAGRAR